MKTIFKGALLGIVLSIPFWLIILSPKRPFSDPLWEIVPTPESSGDIIRMPVPHGWLIAYKNVSRGLVYIPDNKHEWKLNKKNDSNLR
ncbi:hypothetical protein [Legionella jamestowniensis]|uniref:hypothetical protein n=1 Tax=Legionella jamestowniensis TaxID=455 RepID=UPI0008EDFDEC|nr:hypothetical protein [Legionella jamestowniensis]SFM07909.1 hypothetical protein SAMN02746073_0297 [Legionella jamestowniensis DSM 19215]